MAQTRTARDSAARAAPDWPAEHAFAVTTSDTVDLAEPSRGLYVGTGGDLTVIMQSGATVLFPAVPSGAVLPLVVTRVKATGTAASGIVALA